MKFFSTLAFVHLLGAATLNCVLVAKAQLPQLNQGQTQSAQLPTLFPPYAPLPTDTKPTHTKEEIIEIAEKFCRDIGTPITGEFQTKFPFSEEFRFLQFHHEPRWRLTLREEIEMQISDLTGQVVQFRNWKVEQRNSDLHKDAVQKKKSSLYEAKISRQEAVERGFKIFKDIGLDNIYFQFEDAVLTGATVNDLPMFDYRLSWKGYFKNIPFPGHSFGMTLDARTGEVVSLGTTFFSPLPADVETKISANEAGRSGWQAIQNSPDI